MKKLLVVLLTVALTLSLVAVASAADVSTYMGGRFYINYKSNNPTDNPISWNNASADGGKYTNQTFITMNWSIKAEVDNSFIKFQWLNEGWSSPSTENFTYSFGQNNIADIFSWQYNTGAAATTLIGQIPITELDTIGPYDPFFFNRPAGVLALGLTTDAFKANVEYAPNKGSYSENPWVAAFTYNLDNGDVHVGASGYSDLDNGTLSSSYIVGTKFKLEGLGTLVADYYGKKSYGATVYNSTFQAGITLDDLKMGVVLAYVMPNDKADWTYPALQFNYTGINKVNLGLKYISDDGNDTAPGDPGWGHEGGYEVFGSYNVGAFDVRLAYVKPGKADAYFVLGANGQIW